MVGVCTIVSLGKAVLVGRGFLVGVFVGVFVAEAVTVGSKVAAVGFGVNVPALGVLVGRDVAVACSSAIVSPIWQAELKTTINNKIEAFFKVPPFNSLPAENKTEE